ncbi:Bactericidal permeability-increasing protein [Anabarilius grahami]|uniref:Bactericidal permeability-increasing protein n=1 Tax=Anabarilius grahami TaxID=495550 RepID=A0A3N0XKM3_ANAGA|nr:Bactericidal permeability-increasing protein [Anabarilius grahami]
MQLVIYFLMILTYTHADYPALKTLLSEKGLGGVSQMMSVRIQSELKSTAIPEVRGGIDIKIGTVKYVLSNMHVRQCSMPDPSLVFVQGTGVSVKVSQLSLSITGSWATQFGVIHDHGSFNLAMHNIKIYTLLQLGDDAGRLSITTVSCSADIGGVDIQFHGGASFFFKPFVSSFRKKISDMIREKGEFYSRSSPSEPPFSASVFDVQYAENSMLSLAASEFLVNSAAYAFLRSGVLQINITDDMLSTLYPNMEMQVLLYASETPLFSFSSGVIDVHVPAKFSAVKPDGTLVPLFTLDVDCNFSGSALIDKNLTGAFEMKNPGYSAKYTTYSLMEDNTDKVVHFDLVQVTESSSSVAMESFQESTQ